MWPFLLTLIAAVPLVNFIHGDLTCPGTDKVSGIDSSWSLICTTDQTGGGGGAPVDGEYVTYSTNATLTNERVLSAGTATTVDLGTPGEAQVDCVSAATATLGCLELDGDLGGTAASPTVVNVTCTGCIEDTNLASSYSGVGACAANQWASTLNDNAAPTCTQPAFSNISGTVTDAQLANNYSGIGACGANTWASTLNDNAAPTCTQPAFSNLSGSATIAQGGTTETASTKDAVLVGSSTTDWQPKVLPDCANGTTSKLLYAQATNTFSCGTDQTTGGGPQFAQLTTQYTNATTTGTEITQMQVTLGAAGTYIAEYFMIVQSTSTTNGMKFGINYTGTVTRMSCIREFPSTGTTASTGVMDDVAAVLTGSLQESDAANTVSTTAPNLGPNTGVATANVNIYNKIECLLVVANGGDLEIWGGSEAAVQISVEVGSSVRVTAVP